jgi:hypothetical protein
VPAAEGAFDLLKRILGAQRAIGTSDDLEQVVTQVADAALELVPRPRTHTVALREDRAMGPSPRAAWSRWSRARAGATVDPAPQRSVRSRAASARKVLEQRAAVCRRRPARAFPVSRCSAQHSQHDRRAAVERASASWACCKSTAAVRRRCSKPRDVDSLGVLAASASLAVANARLITPPAQRRAAAQEGKSVSSRAASARAAASCD